MFSAIGKYLLDTVMNATVGRITAILRAEYEDAKLELEAKLKQLAQGGALLAVAMFFTIIAAILFMVAAVIGLSEFLPAWAAALAIGAFLILVASILIAIGANKIKKNKDLRPERALTNLRRYFGE